MKKILVSTLIAIMVGATLTGCGNKNTGNSSSVEQASSVSAKEVVEKLNEEGYFMMPIIVDDQTASDIYHLNLDDIVDYGILTPGVTAQQDVIAVVKAKEGKIDDVKASLEEYVQDLLAGHLYPIYMEAAENAKIEVNGDLVSLFIVRSDIKNDVEAKYEELIK
ncbi:MAG: DUF4358 domain-containing protein [Bacilli bacterium]|nr:DUF4358 domain-containing protein [Bacilli bacterium]